MAHLSLCLLGPLSVTLAGEPVTGLASAKARALLAYLAMEAGRPHRRQVLAGLLWPERPEQAARSNLRHALAELRKAIDDHHAAPSYLLTTRETIQFNPTSDCWIDVRAFEALLGGEDQPTGSQLEAAAALYRGSFLEGFALRESVAFEDWSLLTRERLQRLASTALDRLVGHYERRGEVARACEIAWRRVELEPWQEEAHQQVMRLLAVSGQRSAALAQYEQCRRLLAEELDVEPGEETTRLYEEIRDGKLAAPKPKPKGAEADVSDLPPTPIEPVRQRSQQILPGLQERTPSPPRVESNIPHPSPAPLEGERRLTTVLLADVSGSTALLERVGTEAWAEVMAPILQSLEAEVYRYGGEVNQHRGDALVATFGATRAHEDDPERAVLAALAMQAAFDGQTPGAGSLIALRLRVGVNTGQAILPAVAPGMETRRPTMIGGALAFVERVQAAVEPGTVWVSEQTFRLVELLFEWESPGEIAVRGASQPAALYRPLAHKALPSKGRDIAGLSSPLVGRQAELRALQEVVARLRDGLGGIVTLVGEAGIGKSRLVAELRKLALSAGEGSPNLRSPNLKWVEGRCLSYATNVAYQLWVDVVRGLLDVAPDASPAAARETLRERVQALCMDGLEDVYPYLGQMMSLFPEPVDWLYPEPVEGFPPEDEAQVRLRGLDAENLRYLTFRAVETLLKRAALQRALTIVCEDLHWADPTSLALLERLLSLTDRAPLLLLCVFRPRTAHGCWQVRETAARDYRHRHTDLWLEPLTAAQGGTLVGNLLHTGEVDPALRERVLERGAGNPFFVEEILRTLIAAADGGAGIAYDETAGRWQATGAVSALTIPDTLHGVLAARIDRLPAGAKRVLQLASVIGRIFSLRVLECLSERGRQLDDDLVTLQRAQMIRERARVPERVYIFKHVLTQEAAYKSLLSRGRRVLHRRVAETLERLYPEHIEEQLGLLAYHWERAGQAEKAAAYLRRAGEQAAAQFANAEAVAYLNRALDLTPEGDLAERYALLLARERVHDLLGEREAQRQDLAALEALAQVLADPGRQADVALRQVQLAIRMEDQEAAAEAARASLRWAQAAQDDARQAAAHRELGRALRYRYDDRAARVELEQALVLARAAGSCQVEVDALHDLAIVTGRPRVYSCFNPGYPGEKHRTENGPLPGDELAEAEALLTEQLRICRETGNRRDEGRALRDLGLNLLNRAKYVETNAYLEASLQVCRETGNRRDEGWALHSLALVYNELGDHTTARAYGEQALHVHHETGDRMGETWTCVILCWAYARAGDYAGARDWAVQTRAAFVPCRMREAFEAATTWFLGELALSQGDHQRARDHYEAVLRLIGESCPRCGALCGLARITLAEGDLAQAQGYAAQVLHSLQALHPEDVCLGLGLTPHLVRYRVLHASGDARAREVLDEGYRLLRARADAIHDPALRRSYLEHVPANREIIAAWEELAYPLD